MDEGLSFDVYVQITDPHWTVEHDTHEGCASVVFGGPPSEVPPRSALHLWFKDPDTIISLGRELTEAGIGLAAQLRTEVPDTPSTLP